MKTTLNVIMLMLVLMTICWFGIQATRFSKSVDPHEITTTVSSFARDCYWSARDFAIDAEWRFKQWRKTTFQHTGGDHDR